MTCNLGFMPLFNTPHRLISALISRHPPPVLELKGAKRAGCVRQDPTGMGRWVPVFADKWSRIDPCLSVFT